MPKYGPKKVRLKSSGRWMRGFTCESKDKTPRKTIDAELQHLNLKDARLQEMVFPGCWCTTDFTFLIQEFSLNNLIGVIWYVKCNHVFH